MYGVPYNLELMFLAPLTSTAAVLTREWCCNCIEFISVHLVFFGTSSSARRCFFFCMQIQIASIASSSVALIPYNSVFFSFILYFCILPSSSSSYLFLLSSVCVAIKCLICCLLFLTTFYCYYLPYC